ncbi:MAG: glycosyltransferase [Bacteroidaceae bacterium]|nr:glycosyltransferase [Bacteroidaceae bacterium]
MTKISVIIPVYNVEAYLPQCIDSVLSQTFTDFELILVDDGSKDSSLVICQDYASKDIRVKVIHQDNSGVSTARNKGLASATGTWVTFIDSDDWVDEDFLENFCISLNPDADVICQGLKFIDHASESVKRERRFGSDMITAPDDEGKLARYDVLSFGVTVCKCFKMSVIKDFGILFDEKIAYHEDHIFTLEFLSHSKSIVTVDACGYNYRCGHNASSLSKRRHPCKNQVRAGQRMMKELRTIGTRFHLSDSYFKKIATFALSPKIGAVRMAFQDKISRAEMKEMLSPLSEFAKYYSPADKRYRLIKYLAKDPSGCSLYVFFLLFPKISKQ